MTDGWTETTDRYLDGWMEGQPNGQMDGWRIEEKYGWVDKKMG